MILAADATAPATGVAPPVLAGTGLAKSFGGIAAVRGDDLPVFY